MYLWETLPKRLDEGQYICDFGEGGVHAIYTFLQQVAASLMMVIAGLVKVTDSYEK